jgi:hypothetical protein
MSNRRKARPRVGGPLALGRIRDLGWVSDALMRLDGAILPGDCVHCDGHQEVTSREHGEDRITEIRMYHSEECPTLAAAS